MALNDTIYAYAVGRTRALETRLVDRARFERMIEASSAHEALKVLAESDYAAAITELSDIYNFESMLASELKDIFYLIKSISPKPELIDILTLRYDIHNLKVLFKAKYLNIKSELLIPVGSMDVDRLEHSVSEESFRDFPLNIRTALETITDEFLLNKDPQVIDLILDKVLFKQLMVVSREKKLSFLEGLITRQIDLVNLRTLIRVKRMGSGADFLKHSLLTEGSIALDRLLALINEPLESMVSSLSMSEYAEVVAEGVQEWQEKGTASRLEKLSDDHLTNYLKQAKWMAFGFEPLLGYLWGKEIEIKNIRLILVGKINRLPNEAIRERLRNGYI